MCIRDRIRVIEWERARSWYGMSVLWGKCGWRTWLELIFTRWKKSSLAELNRSVMAGMSSVQYLSRLARRNRESRRARSAAEHIPDHAGAAYWSLETTVARNTCRAHAAPAWRTASWILDTVLVRVEVVSCSVAAVFLPVLAVPHLRPSFGGLTYRLRLFKAVIGQISGSRGVDIWPVMTGQTSGHTISDCSKVILVWKKNVFFSNVFFAAVDAYRII